jgi:hypothetical protein
VTTCKERQESEREKHRFLMRKQLTDSSSMEAWIQSRKQRIGKKILSDQKNHNLTQIIILLYQQNLDQLQFARLTVTFFIKSCQIQMSLLRLFLQSYNSSLESHSFEKNTISVILLKSRAFSNIYKVTYLSTKNRLWHSQ